MNLQNISKHASDEEGLDTKADNFLDNPLIRREVDLSASEGFFLAELQALVSADHSDAASNDPEQRRGLPEEFHFESN